MTGDYKFLMVDAETGASHQITLVCLSDSDAMLIGQSIGGGQDVEIWEHHRLVGFVRARRRQGGEIAA